AKEIFELITSDLTEAVELLNGFSRSTKGEINQAVAKGMLAYAYAARGTQEDWQKVADLTNQVITSGAYPLTTYSQAAGVLSIEKPAGSEGYWEWDYKVSNSDAGFNNIETASWMWGADIQVSTGLDLVSWWGQMDLFTYSYTWAGDPKGIDADLYDLIPDNAVSK